MLQSIEDVFVLEKTLALLVIFNIRPSRLCETGPNIALHISWATARTPGPRPGQNQGDREVAEP